MKFFLQNKQKDRLYILLALLMIFAGVTFWLTHVFKSNMLYYVTPAELHSKLKEIHSTKSGTPTHTKWRVGGLVKQGSVQQQEGGWLSFELVDHTGESCVVVFKGSPPELFAENKGLIVDGVWQHNKLMATRLLAKHDESYRVKKKRDKRFTY